MSNPQIDFLVRCRALGLEKGKLSDWLDEIEALRTENEALKQQVEQGKRDAVPEDIRKDAERWRAIVAEAERDYVEVPSHEEPYWQRLECTEAMEEWADAAIAAAPKQEK